MILAQVAPIPVDKDWFDKAAHSPWWFALFLLIGYMVYSLSKNRGVVSLKISGAQELGPTASQAIKPEHGHDVETTDIFELRQDLRVDREAQTKLLRGDHDRLSQQVDTMKREIVEGLGVIARQRYDASASSTLTQDEMARQQTALLRKLLEGLDKVWREVDARLPPSP